MITINQHPRRVLHTTLKIIDGNIHFIYNTEWVKLWPFEKESEKLVPLRERMPALADHNSYTINAVAMIGPHSDHVYHFPTDYVWNFYVQNILEEKTSGSAEYRGTVNQSKILVMDSKINGFVKQWIKILYPKIQDDNIIFLQNGSTISCKHLLPVGKTMGNMSRIDLYSKEEIASVRNRIINNLNLSETKQDSLLLLKRNFCRLLQNWDDVDDICKKYCKENNLKLIYHDDSKDLGSIDAQLKKFNSAKIVIGCHGAGFTNLIACKKDTILIEFLAEAPRAGGEWITGSFFTHLAACLDIKYHTVIKKTALNDNPSGAKCNVDIEKFKKKLYLL